MEPTNKSLEIDVLLSVMYGKDRKATIRDGMCMTCTGTANNFVDALSEREYTIGGMCQQCQDKVYE
tara:strand:+ start:1559 stop:1756 length:198 start_codon:yes stop_codon:yes gene_type:complete